MNNDSEASSTLPTTSKKDSPAPRKRTIKTQPRNVIGVGGKPHQTKPL